MARTAASRKDTSKKQGYPAWAVAAVIAVALGLMAAAVRVATLEKPGRAASSAPAPTVETAPPPAAEPPVKPPAPKPPAPKPPAKPPAKPPEPKPAPVAAEPPEPEPEAVPPPPAPTHATAWARGRTEKVTVKRIVDGDTFETTTGRKVRLVGINTPEKTSDDPLNKDATALLRELVEGQEVTLEFDRDEVDQYKRTLAYVHKGDLFVNGEIVRQGLAYCYTWEPNTAHKDELIAWQREARQAKAGLWSLPPPPPAERYLGVRGQHRFHRPDCKFVKKVDQGRRIEFATRDAALDEGENPCNECKP